MKTISFDVMGNDNGVKSAVAASIKFIKSNKDYKIILVGSKTEINKYILSHDRIDILDIEKVADVKRGALVVRDKDTSMYHAINLVKNKKADIVLSSGSSAGYIAYTTLMFKKLDGIARPAFMPIFPTVVPNQRFVMMDVGATLQVDGNLLHNWAKLGNSYSKEVLKTKKPKIAILNVGSEINKGLAHHLEAYKLIEKDKHLNFIGFVEPRNLLNYVADVVVTDGYAGNVCLKSMEGTGRAISTTLSKSMKKNPLRIIGALMSRGGFKNLKSTLDFRNVGGAWVIGLEGIAIKTHGSADTKAYMGAFNLIKDAIENDAIEKLRKAVK